MKKYILILLSLLVYTCSDDDPAGPVDGCMDSTACNYDASATIDLLDSCTYPIDDNTNCDGTCGGVNNAVEDCAGTCAGTLELDQCDICDSNVTNDCTQDCLGIWGGDALVDECGICDGDNS